MGSLVKRYRLVWLGLGLLAGLLLAGLWPHTPLHAVATDRAENITVATGFVDADVEAVFFLDSLTGTLVAAVPSRQRKLAPFQSMWQANVNADLAGVIRTVNAAQGKRGPVRPILEAPKTPRYIMSTGVIDVPGRSAREAIGRSLVYVVEANTGIVLVYAVPWSANLHMNGSIYRGQLVLWTADQFATAVIRSEE